MERQGESKKIDEHDEPQDTFTFADLIDAWREVRGPNERRPSDYHLRRYHALAKAFRVELELPPNPRPPMPDWVNRRPGYRDESADWAGWVHDFVIKAEDAAREARTPWDGMLEAPESLIAIYNRYQRGISDSIDRAKSELRTMSDELLAVLYPDLAQKTVTAEELRAAGFDPDESAPDPLDDF